MIPAISPSVRRLLAVAALVAVPNGFAAAQQAPTAAPLPGSGAPGGGQFSPTLGISYQLVPYYGAYGARLTQYPPPGSPLAQAQIQLEPGDLITHLDGMPIRDPGELERHHSQTSVTFVNIRTGLVETRWATLPPWTGGGGVVPPPPPPPVMLGVNAAPVQVAAPIGAAAAPGFPTPAPPTLTTALRIVSVTPGSPAAYAGLVPGETILTAGPYTANSIVTLRQAVAQSGGVLPLTVMDLYGNVRSVTAYLGGIGAAAAPAAAPAPTAAPAPDQP